MTKNSSFVLFGLAVSIYAIYSMKSTNNKKKIVKPSNALKFFRVVGKLKTLKRTGWINHAVLQPESVADHMYRMTMLSFLIKDDQVDRDRLMKICLVIYAFFLLNNYSFILK